MRSFVSLGARFVVVVVVIVALDRSVFNQTNIGIFA